MGAGRAAGLRSDYADAHYNLGLVLQNLGRREEAVAAFSRTLEIDPDEIEAALAAGQAAMADFGPFNAAEEIRRIAPVITELRRRHPTLAISADTTKTTVARAALEATLEAARSGEVFAAAGRDMSDYITLLPVMPFYRLYWEDGYSFDYSNDLEATTQQIADKSPGDVDGYRRFLDYAEDVFHEGYTKLAATPFLDFWSMIRVSPQLMRLQSYRSVYSMVSKFIKDDQRLRLHAAQWEMFASFAGVWRIMVALPPIGICQKCVHLRVPRILQQDLL